MALDRRSFLARTGLTAAAAGLAPRSGATAGPLVSAEGGLDWTSVRGLFNLSPGGFYAYEHYWAVEAALSLHDQLGRGRIAARIAELNGRLRSELAAMKHVTLHTPVAPELAAGIMVSPDEVETTLREIRALAA